MKVTNQKGPTWLAGLAGAALWVGSAQAQALDSPLELSWVAPRACPDAAAVRADVLRLARVDSGFSRHLKARGSIQGASGAWQLVLTTEFEGTVGERRLSAGSCGALTDAAVLTLALILNPEAEPEQPATKPSSASAPAPEALRTQASPVRVRGLVAGHVGLQVGILDAPAPELGLGLGLSIGDASIWAIASSGLPQDNHVDGASGPGGRLWWISAAALGCWQFKARRIVIGPCAGVELTRLEGTGIGVSSPQKGTTRWASATLGVTVGVRVNPALTLKLGGFSLVPTRRPSLFLEGIGQVQRPAAIAGQARASAEFEFP